MHNKEICERLENTVSIVVDRISKKKNVYNWEYFNEENLFSELVACILGSNIKFEMAQAFTEHLDNLGLYNIAQYSSFDSYEIEVAEALSQSIYHRSGDYVKNQKYRFPFLKASHIRRTAESIYSNNSLKSILKESHDPYSARNNLMERAVGIGPKQSSLFLRNIGFSDNLAILDVHVMRYMSLIGLISLNINKISSLSNYEKLENVLSLYAEKMRTNMSILDTSIWVVMRVYNKEKLH